MARGNTKKRFMDEETAMLQRLLCSYLVLAFGGPGAGEKSSGTGIRQVKESISRPAESTGTHLKERRDAAVRKSPAIVTRLKQSPGSLETPMKRQQRHTRNPNKANDLHFWSI